jgi:tetratricopeptide (TPR) repeat protein
MAAQATVPLEKAKRREPNKASIRESLGIAYFRIGRYDEAAAEFRAILELAPNDDYAHYALGRCPREAGPLPRRRTGTTSLRARCGRVEAVRRARPRPRRVLGSDPEGV